MANYSRTQHSMQGAFIFVLLGLFALMSTLMVLLGAQMYRKLNVYAGAEHPHAAQKPEVLNLK